TCGSASCTTCPAAVRSTAGLRAATLISSLSRAASFRCCLALHSRHARRSARAADLPLALARHDNPRTRWRYDRRRQVFLLLCRFERPLIIRAERRRRRRSHTIRPLLLLAAELNPLLKRLLIELRRRAA